MGKITIENPVVRFAEELDKISRTVSVGLKLLIKMDEADLLDVNFIRRKEGKPLLGPNRMKEECKLWILQQGFTCVVNILSQFLETIRKQALLYTNSQKITNPDGTARLESTADPAEFAGKMTKIAQKFHFLAFNAKLDFLEKNYSITCPKHKVEILSLNKTRNCLVHQNGLVTEKDVNKEGKTLQIDWLGVDFYVNDILEKGEIPFKIERGGRLSAKTVARTKEFKTGNQIEISPKDFREMTMTMHFFVNELSEGLEKLKPK